MAKIKLEFATEPFDGQIVTFSAPCACEDATGGLVINGNTYTVVDALGNALTGGGAWCSGALVSVTLDVANRRAFFLNATAVEHTHTPEEIGAAPAYTYGTTDLTAGTSPLETGKLYFVYE